MHTRCLIAAVAIGAFRVVAAPPTAPPVSPSHAYQRPAKPPMDLLTKTMAGQRVLAAGWSNWSAAVPEKGIEHAGTFVGKLQAVGEAASSPERPIIPFVVRNAWVLAPETREEVNTDVSGAAMTYALPRNTLLEMALTQLSKDQVIRLGSARGLALSEFPKDAQTAFIAAFHPPMDICDLRPRTVKGRDGVERSESSIESVRKITEPLDPARIRIRANLKTNGIQFDAGKDQSGFIIGDYVDRWPQFMTDLSASPMSGAETNLSSLFLREVPNRFKPSDLDGKRYGQPIGIQGAFWLADVLKQLEKVTGLHLRGASGYRDMAVFIGTDRVECGEVMDGLRLALTACWRKLADTYVLAWDRRGIGALQLLAQESSMDLQERTSAASGEIDTSPGWLTIAYNLPFAAGDPLALNDNQRHALFDPIWNLGDGLEKTPRIPYTEMTPEQQEHLRSLIGNAKTYVSPRSRGPNGYTSEDHPTTDSDVTKAYLVAGYNIDLSIEIPDLGWVAPPINWLGSSVYSYRLSKAHKRASGEPAGVTPFLKLLQGVKPCALLAEIRALMVPILTPARLATLADEMKRHGFNTLFYPALYDGYASIPSSAFPQNPLLHGSDGFSEAVRLMKPAGINVIGYISTLAWRNAGDKTHWLDAHPEWIDTDLAGRPRRDVALRGKRLKRRATLAAHAPGNAVRPTELAVAAKLKRFISEFARRKDAGAVAFTDVYTDQQEVYDSAVLPALGYALPERIAVVKAGGDDPVDVALNNSPYPGSFTPKSPGANIDRVISYGPEGSAKTETRPCADLLSALLKQVKSEHKDTKTWLVDSVIGMSSGRQPPAPNPDRMTPDISVPSPEGARNRTMLVSVGPYDTYWKDDTPDVERAFPAIVHAMMPFSHPEGFMGMGEGTRFSAIILDFRVCPEDITDALKWVTP